jgi:2,3-bisphosphoglycerate-dependent phosphoglycerate mutase
MPYEFVLLRHGESTWNLENRFTGWADVPLTAGGIEEAHTAARLLDEAGFKFDLAFTSVLERAIHTLWIVLADMDLQWIPVDRDWRLNERHYGALQGLNKHETAQRLGEDLVHTWRRSYAAQPPALAWDDPLHPRFEQRYAHLPPDQLPAAESLADTYQRVIRWWQEKILSHLLDHQRLLIVGHGNRLRALVKHLDQTTDDAIPEVYIPTWLPCIYQLDEKLAVTNCKYLRDQPEG